MTQNTTAEMSAAAAKKHLVNLSNKSFVIARLLHLKHDATFLTVIVLKSHLFH